MTQVGSNPPVAALPRSLRGVFLVAQTTDPENVRFLALDDELLPQHWHAIVTYGFVQVDGNHFIGNMLLPIVLFVRSLAAAIFGWFPAVGHDPQLAGALVGLLLLSLFRAHHRPLADEDEPEPAAGRA